MLTLRTIMAAFKQKEVDERKTLSPDDEIALLSKLVKQRRESIGQYEQAGRPDMCAKEKAELDIIRSYLPEPLNEAEVDKLLEQVIAEIQPAGMKDMGKVMAALKPLLQGRADMSAVSAKIRARLSG